jgi:heat shock protein HslJ
VWIWSVLIVALLLGLTGCGNSRDPLEGTAWELESYGGTPPIEGTTVTARFSEGEVAGNLGCNHYAGAYRVDGDEIAVDQIAVTEMYCEEPQEVMAQETRIVRFLEEVEEFGLRGDRLELLRQDGEALVFRRGE